MIIKDNLKYNRSKSYSKKKYNNRQSKGRMRWNIKIDYVKIY